MSNGVMLQDYRPQAINNLTEQIWMQGGVIPRGKRVVVGPNRNGWQEITFAMGSRQEFIGMALVPPMLVQLEAARLEPRGLGQARGLAQTTAERMMMPGVVQSGAWRGGAWHRGAWRGHAPHSRFAALGLGAAGASDFTVRAAEELDEHLTTNGCAGCDDYKSALRQLTFKFKAACLTDPAIQNQVSFNMSTPLAMTAYGIGTDKALSMVLGQKRTYEGGACTDDGGACLGNLPQIAAVTPVELGPLINQVVSQVTNQIGQHRVEPVATQLGRQENLVAALVGAMTGLLTALSAAVAKFTPAMQPAPAPTPAETEKKKSVWPTVLLGGLIGALVLGGSALVYTQVRKGAYA